MYWFNKRGLWVKLSLNFNTHLTLRVMFYLKMKACKTPSQIKYQIWYLSYISQKLLSYTNLTPIQNTVLTFNTFSLDPSQCCGGAMQIIMGTFLNMKKRFHRIWHPIIKINHVFKVKSRNKISSLEMTPVCLVFYKINTQIHSQKMITVMSKILKKMTV